MPRRRKTKPETRLRKVQAELHNIKNVVRWAIKELRHPHLHGQANGVANELARIIGEQIIETPVATALEDAPAGAIAEVALAFTPRRAGEYDDDCSAAGGCGLVGCCSVRRT